MHQVMGATPSYSSEPFADYVSVGTPPSLPAKSLMARTPGPAATHATAMCQAAFFMTASVPQPLPPRPVGRPPSVEPRSRDKTPTSRSGQYHRDQARPQHAASRSGSARDAPCHSVSRTRTRSGSTGSVASRARSVSTGSGDARRRGASREDASPGPEETTLVPDELATPRRPPHGNTQLSSPRGTVVNKPTQRGRLTTQRGRSTSSDRFFVPQRNAGRGLAESPRPVRHDTVCCQSTYCAVAQRKLGAARRPVTPARHQGLPVPAEVVARAAAAGLAEAQRCLRESCEPQPGLRAMLERVASSPHLHARLLTMSGRSTT